MKFLLFGPIICFFVGCANVSTTKFSFHDEKGATVTVEMPKELTAENLTVEIDAINGKATIKADSIKTENLEAIKAQQEAFKNAAASITKAGVEAAIMSVAPHP